MTLNILLDRDGTIIEDKHYLSDPAGVSLLPGAAESLLALARAGARLFIVTNQSGLGRKYFTLADYKNCEKRLDELLKEHNIPVIDVAFCPHAPEDDCLCRKPFTGMWQELATKHKLDPGETIMIGDKLDDILFGLNAGFSSSVLVLTGKGASEVQKGKVAVNGANLQRVETEEVVPAETCDFKPVGEGREVFVAKNLPAAANWIIKKMTKGDKC